MAAIQWGAGDLADGFVEFAPAPRLGHPMWRENCDIDLDYHIRSWQLKGSLETGKLADLVVLEGNPLTVDPMAIKDIRVIETIKEGQTVYRA
jgi:hypothetical protein